MSVRDLRDLLERLEDRGEFVLRAQAAPRDELQALWREARDEARAAYAAWCLRRGAAAYAVYRAAEDRADAALSALREAQPGFTPARA